MAMHQTPDLHRYAAAVVALSLQGVLCASAHAQAQQPNLELAHALEASRTCQECHAFPNRPDRQSEPAYAPYAWKGTTMGNAARDPVFWAAVALAAQDDPAHTQDCIKCHSPKAFFSGRKDATHPSQLKYDDFEGVGCDVCHRMSGASQLELGNAAFHLDDALTDGQESPDKRGPWNYDNFPTQRLNHGWSDDNVFLASSESCGTCHNVTTPRPWVDAAGAELAPGFPEQRTYTEWKQSAFAQQGSPEFRSCQDCHMQAVADVAGARVMDREGMLHATGGRRHQFAGANIPMLEFMRQKLGDTGERLVPSAYFDDAIAVSKQQLAGAAKLTLSAPPSANLAQGLGPISLRVENLSGHKLPTGYSEGRVMWVELTARFRGQVVFKSGYWDQATRSIENDPQVRRYEGIAQQAGTGIKNHLLKNNQWVLDTRIPAKGMRPHPEIDPISDRYAIVNGTWLNYDDFEYQFPAPTTPLPPASQNPAENQLEVTARLLYWINTDAYIQQLATDNASNDSGQSLLADWQAFPGKVPIEMTKATVMVPLQGLEAGPGEPGQGGPPGVGGEGCACRQSDSRPWLWSLLGLLGLISLRRRARNRTT